MSNEVDPRTSNTSDNNGESAVPHQQQSELSDDDLKNVAGGSLGSPQQPVDPLITVRKAGGDQNEY